MSSLRISDAGKYQCVVHSADGADYKTIALSVEGEKYMCCSVGLLVFFSEDFTSIVLGMVS